MILCLVIFLVALSACYSLSIWPQPQNIVGEGSTTLQVDEFFSFSSGCEGSTVLSAAFKRYEELIKSSMKALGKSQMSMKGDYPLIGFCSVVIGDSEAQLDFGVSESYTLSVTEDGVCSIQADTIWGELRGIETFSQLLEGDVEEGVLVMNSAPIVISDSPRFPHRLISFIA